MTKGDLIGMSTRLGGQEKKSQICSQELTLSTQPGGDEQELATLILSLGHGIFTD